MLNRDCLFRFFGVFFAFWGLAFQNLLTFTVAVVMICCGRYASPLLIIVHSIHCLVFWDGSLSLLRPHFTSNLVHGIASCGKIKSGHDNCNVKSGLRVIP